jgi:hypothetical protein
MYSHSAIPEGRRTGYAETALMFSIVSRNRSPVRRLVGSTACCGLLILAARPAAAQSGTERRTAVTIVAGGDAIVRGPFNDAAETSGLFGTFQVFAHSFDDIYNPPLRIGGEISRSVTTNSDVFVRVTYTSASAGNPVAFEQSRPLDSPALAPRTATFSDYHAWTFEGGVRRFLAKGAVRPFVAASGGLTVVDAIAISECCVFAGANSRLFARSNVPVAAALAGIDVMLGNGGTSIGIESGFRYQFGLGADLGDLRVGPFVTDDTFPGRRWSIPLSATVRVRF